MIFRDQADLDGCVAKWQRLLRLLDWRITARLLEGWDAGERLGTIVPNWNAKTAVLDVNTCTRNGLRYHDQEQTVVHELLHLLTQPIVRELCEEWKKSCEPEELCINLVADALLALDRNPPVIWPETRLHS